MPYAKPGRYVLKLRCVQNDALSEFRISVVVSRDQKLGDPLIVLAPSHFRYHGENDQHHSGWCRPTGWAYAVAGG